MANIQIAVINASTLMSDADISAAIPALQTQISRDFAPVWGVDASLRFVPKGQNPLPTEWWLTVVDDPDHANSLGYHDLTKQGLPIAKIFARTIQHYKESWTVTASHELLEMLADPNINLTVLEDTKTGGRLYAYEVCDACEGDDFGYAIDGVLVSDFVYPAWFETFQPAGTQFDHAGKITQALQLLKGGYISIYDIQGPAKWTQLTAEAINMRARPPIGSRRERRTIPVDQRVRSTAH
ncbi:MAG: hypothetical protein JO142_09920 [Burkholderiales bacterium]|nr:hypothetical protein [Burkholderiales bacterium]